jgi:GNAT superfamily N-acetyltransferase
MGARLSEVKISSDHDAPYLDVACNDPKFNIKIEFHNYQKNMIGNVFERFNVSEIFHFVLLSVNPKYRRRGLGRLLLSAEAALAKGLYSPDGEGVISVRTEDLR